MSGALYLLTYGLVCALLGAAAASIWHLRREEIRERRRHKKITRRTPVLAQWRPAMKRAMKPAARHRAGEVRPAADWPRRDMDAPTQRLPRRVDPDATAEIDVREIRRG